MLDVRTPATIFDMAELAGAATWFHWRVAREMWSSGETYALEEDGRLIGLFGLYPTETGAEAWFSVRPDCERHMMFLVRRIRLTLKASHYPEIVVFCVTAQGQRIANACGFDFLASSELGEIWKWQTSSVAATRPKRKRWRFKSSSPRASSAAA